MTQTAARDAERPRNGPASTRARRQPAEAQEDHQLQLRDSFWRWGRVAFVLIAIFVVVQLLHMVQGIVDAVITVLLYVVFGGIVAVVLAPIDRVFRRRLSPGPSALLSLLIAVAGVAGVGYAISLPLVHEAQSLGNNLPRLQAPFIQLQTFLVSHGINISLGSLASSLGIQTSGAGIGAAILHAVSVTVQLLIDVIITLVTAFWLMRDRHALRRGLLAALPGRVRVDAEFVLDAFIVVVGGYVRGQLALALLVGVMAFLGCLALGVPLPLLVGFAAGVFELIPLAGPIVGAAVGALFAYTVSPVLTLETIGLFIVIHVIEGYFVSPRVQGRFVHLHPLISLLALLAGVYAGGFLGAFVAVPVASLVAVVARARIAELRIEEPELFAFAPRDPRGVRRRLLGEYRLGLGAALRRMTRRVSRRSPAEPR